MEIGSLGRLATAFPTHIHNSGMKALHQVSIIALIALSSLSQAHGQPNSTLTNGLIAFYRFGSNIVDSSPQGNNLQDPQGGFTNGMLSYGVDRFGIASSSLVLSNAYAQLRSMNNLGITGNQHATISVWIKPQAQVEGIWLAGFGSLGSSMSAFALSLKDVSVSGLRLFHSVPPGFGATRGEQTVSTTAVGNLTGWNHLVAVYPGNVSNVCLYLNGQLLSGSLLRDSTSSSTTLNVPGTPLVVGVQPQQDLSGNMKGSLDDLRVYDRALSSEEVVLLYNLERPVYEVTLVLKSSTNMASWASVYTNIVETFNAQEFYKKDISVRIKPPTW